MNAIRVIATLLAAAITIAVPLSVWPGLIPEIFLISAVFAVFWIPVLLCVYALTKSQVCQYLHRPHVFRNVLMTIAVSGTLCGLALPQRLAFFACRSRFDRIIADSGARPRGSAEVWFGLYYVHGPKRTAEGARIFKPVKVPMGLVLTLSRADSSGNQIPLAVHLVIRSIQRNGFSVTGIPFPRRTTGDSRFRSIPRRDIFSGIASHSTPLRIFPP